MNTQHLFSTCLLAAALLTHPGWAAGPALASSITGEVLEVRDVEMYTYLRLKTSQGETWAAVGKAAVKKGALVTIDNVSVMENFESKTLKTTFKTIVFGDLGGTGKAAISPHTGISKPVQPGGPIKVAKASGAHAYTVAEIVTQAAQLKDKPVQVSGKVVKYNAGIMGKNWLHLQDGSGTAAAGSNDILVTSSASAKLGDVVTAAGTVRRDKDFGAGYSYKVLIEDATLKP
ncbi:MAG: nucleotide-binding protein [Rhodoferax sp.]